MKVEDTPLSAGKDVAVYARVSTEQQSLEQQLSACERFCKYKLFNVQKVYKDYVTASAKKKRPAFNDLIKDIRAMKYDGIVVFRLDRLFRNVVEAVNYIQEFQNKGIRLWSINENFDTDTAMGRAQLNFSLVLAQLERENISEATKERLAALKADGKQLGRPATSTAQIQKIIRLRRNGLSYRQIAEKMKVKKSTVAKYAKLVNEEEDEVKT